MATYCVEEIQKEIE